MLKCYSVAILLIFVITVKSQPPQGMHWNKAGDAYYEAEDGEINLYSLPAFSKKTIVSPAMLTVPGGTGPLSIYNFFFCADGSKALIYTNAQTVWRYKTRGDYWVLDIAAKRLKQLGKGLPPASLMFAKFSPDGKQVAYVSAGNIYTEDVATNKIKQLTFDGTRKYINGTFDWVYEEEFFCRDGFRWSPDSKKIAYWNIDARKTKDYLMINNTDSIYPFVKPVEYPIAGEAPSPFKIGVVDVTAATTKWMDIPTDPVLQSYVTRMEWAANSDELILQHLSRRQNVSDVMLCNVNTGAAATIYHEEDPAWIDIIAIWDEAYSYGGWDWFNNGKEFLWASEKDGWRHLYRVSRDGKTESLITHGDFDVMNIDAIDEPAGYVYFDASPANATQRYLYRTKLDGTGMPERLTPVNQAGTNNYEVSPTGKYARHNFSNHYIQPVKEWVSLPAHKALNGDNVNRAIAAGKAPGNVSYFTLKTAGGADMDAWMVKPTNFDSTKKYPLVFYVYSEPWGQTVIDQYGANDNFLYNGDMAADGYITVSIDNRGVILPKGREWRKSISHKIGQLNIDDQAAAAREIIKLPYIDTARVAVWGWSGGGSATLNLMFRYPGIYKTGIAIASESSMFTYDNVYQERYMGLPQEHSDDYVKGSAVTYAKNLQGHLLFIQGTGDDNVHYKNAEMLLNELIKYNKIFQFMPYPNRTHGIFEGEGTTAHLSNLYTTFLKQWCPPGGR